MEALRDNITSMQWRAIVRGDVYALSYMVKSTFLLFPYPSRGQRASRFCHALIPRLFRTYLEFVFDGFNCALARHLRLYFDPMSFLIHLGPLVLQSRGTLANMKHPC